MSDTLKEIADNLGVTTINGSYLNGIANYYGVSLATSTDLKTSILVNGQVPEYVRDEYPKFVAFLQAYYEFLEQKQGSEINDLATVAKNLRTIKDVDEWGWCD